jgi:hypothetical protein
MSASCGSVAWPISLLSGHLDELTAHLETSGDSRQSDDVTRMLLRLIEIQMPHPQPREIGQLYDQRSKLLNKLADRRHKMEPGFTAEEIAEADQAVIENHRQELLEKNACEGWQFLSPLQRSGATAGDSRGWLEYAGWISAQLSVLLLLWAGTANLVARIMLTGSAESTVTFRLGIWRSVVVWLLAAATTFALFGLAPAGVIGHRVQGWGSLGVLAAILFVLPLAAARVSRWHFSTRRLLLLVAYYAAVFGAILYWDRSASRHAIYGEAPPTSPQAMEDDHPWRHLPPHVWMPPHGAGELRGDQVLHQYGPYTFYDVIDGGDPDPNWRPLDARNLHTAGLQWVVYHGLGWTLALGLAGIGIWTPTRARRRPNRMNLEDRPLAPRRWLAAAVAQSLARAALAAAIVSLAAYLAMAPERIAHFEASYQDNLLQVLHPEQYWRGLNDHMRNTAPDLCNVPKLPPSIAWP